MIPVLLSGHVESKPILPASSWLLRKYAPGWTPCWLNYGAYAGPLFSGTYVALRDGQHDEGARAWARDLHRYVQDSHAETEFLILGLDDFLLSAPVDHEAIDLLRTLLAAAPDIAAARLSTLDPTTLFAAEVSYLGLGRGVVRLAKTAPYTVTAQYTLWRTSVLLQLLTLPHVDTPWRFEIGGTEWLNAMPYQVIGLVPPPMSYPDASALSSRWPGVRIEGNDPADITALIALGLLPDA